MEPQHSEPDWQWLGTTAKIKFQRLLQQGAPRFIHFPAESAEP
jgi:hypothetical protein